jgi:hypothetical protein
MSKISAAFVAVLFSCSSLALAQTPSQDKPLGDLAREQKAQKNQQTKGAKKLSVVEASNNSSAPASAVETTSSTQKPVAVEPVRSQAASSQADTVKSKQSDVFDHALNSKTEPLVVPAGTEIRVDLVEGKVIVPVRVGFATPIPALSKVAVQVNRTYYPTGFINTSDRVGYVGYADYATLTAVTVGGRTYPVESAAIPVATPGSSAVTVDNTLGCSPHDAKFVLSAPVAIER